LQLLSCGCAHSKVQPNRARWSTSALTSSWRRTLESSEENFRALRPRSLESSEENSSFLQGRTLERWTFQQLSWSSSPLRRLIRASPLSPGLPHRVRSTRRVSHPLGGLLLARTPGLVSCRKRPWGSTLQGLSLTTRSCSSSPQNYPLGVPPTHSQQINAGMCGV
jgi:hypothetical protein